MVTDRVILEIIILTNFSHAFFKEFLGILCLKKVDSQVSLYKLLMV